MSKQVSNQMLNQPESWFHPVLMRQREGKDGGGKGPLISEEKSLTLATSDDTAFTVATHQDQQIYFGFDGDVPKDQTLSETISTREGGITDTAHAVAQPVAFTTEQTPKFNDDCALTLTKQSPTGGGQPQCVSVAMQVRRLTPVECERLQGFPDGYTNIPWRKKDEAPDGPRYKALGNSMAVPCMKWIGERIGRQAW
jgi:site-specific DNA-cytosine methylase